MPEIIFIENISPVSDPNVAMNLAEKMNNQGKRTKVYFHNDKDNPINFYRAAYFTSSTYRRTILNFTIYSGELIDNTILLSDMRIVRFEDKGKELFVNPILGVLKGRDFTALGGNVLPLDDYINVYKSAFYEFSKGDFKDVDFIIFDDSFVKRRLNDFMNMYNLSPEKSVNYINDILQNVKKIHTVVLCDDLSCEEDISIFKNLNCSYKKLGELLP